MLNFRIAELQGNIKVNNNNKNYGYTYKICTINYRQYPCLISFLVHPYSHEVNNTNKTRIFNTIYYKKCIIYLCIIQLFIIFKFILLFFLILNEFYYNNKMLTHDVVSRFGYYRCNTDYSLRLGLRTTGLYRFGNGSTAYHYYAIRDPQIRNDKKL